MMWTRGWTFAGWEWSRTTYAVIRLSPSVEAALDRVGRADERGELEVLVRKFGEFDARPPAKLVTERRYLHRVEGVNAAVLPHAMQGLRTVPRRAFERPFVRSKSRPATARPARLDVRESASPVW